MNVLVRKARTAVGYAGAPFIAGWYVFKEHDKLSEAISQQVDPIVASMVGAYAALEVVDVALESGKSTWSDGVQRTIGRCAAIAGGVLGSQVASHGRPILEGIAGATAGLATAEITMHVAPRWGNLEAERSGRV